MPDMRFEKRRQWVEEQLTGFGSLSAVHRRFLSVPLMRSGWHVLIDRSEPFPPPGRAGAFAVGPTGVFAFVFSDNVPDRSDLTRVRVRAEETFVNVTAGRNQYVPHMIELLVLTDQVTLPPLSGVYTMLDPKTLPQYLFENAAQLARQRARDIAFGVAARFDRFELISADDAPSAETVLADGLFETADLREDERSRMLKRPFKDWMTFLDPQQLDLVYRNFNGPARFSGPAGTGKSVVAIHRMAHFAKHHPGRMLFTSFVKTLPTYHQSGFLQLAPHAESRAQFIGLHAWAKGFLRGRGTVIEPDDGQIEDTFSRVWRGVARDHLTPVHPSPSYWKDEIHRIIKGRGLTALEEYQQLERKHRHGVLLGNSQRAIVWNELFDPYQALLAERGLKDFNDLITTATDELRAAPQDDPYGLVVVDEVQDFTFVELRLVHQIAGGTSTSRLLLVGDGQQQVYPGGWRMRDAGVPIVGRGAKLQINYRNREAILAFAQQVNAVNTVDDLDGAPSFTLRDSEAVLPDGTATLETVAANAVDTRVVDQIRDCGFAPGDIAVITTTRKDAKHLRQLLERKGFHALSLEHYDGTDDTRIKVGTVHRAKGMDFAAVLHIVRESALPDDAELSARQIMVARSRARDYVWECRIQG
ncbi:MAG: putative UvrD/REP helicase [Nocardia sp.]|uniref:UvrD-helicase domain-containing protein n=1 Tax=Nocardia sp. TaxID=1821 RepID=UPI00260F36D9|nr:UvrD-helicase domain-containing protein [Nocardia sp.]MCU1648305.1 putative UvrD/REP helicase [Nocardia sp.]